MSSKNFFYGVGVSENPDTLFAVKEAFKLANPEGVELNFILMFSTARHNPEIVNKTLVQLAGEKVKICGGYAVGLISNEYIGYDGYQLGMLVVKDPSILVDVFWGQGIESKPDLLSEKIGKEIEAFKFSGDPSVLLFYDSVDYSTGKYRLNMAEPFLSKLAPYLNPHRTAGAGFVGDMVGSPTFQWVEGKIVQNALLAIAFHGNVTMNCKILHGAEPAGAYHTVTKADGNTILEIDDSPALDFINNLFGEKNSPDAWKKYAFTLTLGVNNGEPFGAFEEGMYRNRMCLKVDRDRNGLVMFEPDLVKGSQVQLMRRSLDFQSLKKNVIDFIEQERLAEREPLFGLYIDCAGRAASFSGKNEEEADYVRTVFSSYKIPLLGFYSGVELGAVGNELVSLDWTGVLCIFSRPSATDKIAGQGAIGLKGVGKIGGEKSAPDSQKLEYYSHSLDRVAAEVIKLDTENTSINHKIKQKMRTIDLLNELYKIDYSNSESDVFLSQFLAIVNSSLSMEASALFVREKGVAKFLKGAATTALDENSMSELAPNIFENLELYPSFFNKKSKNTDFSLKVKKGFAVNYYSFAGLSVGEVDLALVVGRSKELLPFQPPLDVGDAEILKSILGLVSNITKHKVLQNILLRKEKAEALVEAEMLAVSFVQESLFPSKTELINMDMSIIYKAADGAGGDWYYAYGDLVTGRNVFFLADVTGHGISAAIVTGVICGSIMSSLGYLHLRPEEFLKFAIKRLNEALFLTAGRSEKQATLTGVVVDTKEKKVYFSNAAHPAPLMKSKGEVTNLFSPGPLLGGQLEIQVDVESVEITPGDILLLYSDGLFENCRENGQPIRERSLEKALAKATSSEMMKEMVVSSIDTNWGTGKQEDDLTVICLGYN